MERPPSSRRDQTRPADAIEVARRITEFGADLAGVLRRAPVVELLMRHVRETFSPTVVAVSLKPDDGGGAPELHIWPGDAEVPSSVLAGLGREGRLLSEAGVVWCVAPLRASGRTTGSIAVRDPVGHYAAVAPSLLEALAAQASVAIESARLVDLHEDGRRSWQEIVDALTLALCIVDREGRIRRANRAVAQLVNTPPPALVGRPWRAFTPAEWAAEIQRLVNAGGAGPEVELRTQDRRFSLAAVPITEGDSSIVVLLFDDQTERRSLQEKLVQSTKLSAMGQLIAGVAHELNNPLASVIGFADFLGEMRDVPPNLREPLGVIREEAGLPRSSAIC
jgi:signal transduction histidine kinase